jgi:hypothetical protein
VLGIPGFPGDIRTHLKAPATAARIGRTLGTGRIGPCGGDEDFPILQINTRLCFCVGEFSNNRFLPGKRHNSGLIGRIGQDFGEIDFQRSREIGFNGETVFVNVDNLADKARSIFQFDYIRPGHRSDTQDHQAKQPLPQ